MHTKEHICPYGLRSKDLLERKGYKIDDHKLSSREETDKFKGKHGVETTPQTFINDNRIGGYDELREFFDMGEAGQTGTTYTPVIAIFATAFLMALGIVFGECKNICIRASRHNWVTFDRSSHRSLCCTQDVDSCDSKITRFIWLY